MKRRIAFGLVVALIAAMLVLSERRKADAPVSPAALLYLIADTQHELTRLPYTATRLSDQEEIQIGNKIAKSFEYREHVSDENKPEYHEVQNYVTDVGMRVAARAQRKLPYKFHYLPDLHLVNAFAIPGGHVFIGGGLIAVMDSEDQLASVLAHEIEHIDLYHCAERVQLEARLRRIPLGSLIGLPIEVFTAGYSKDNELAADREGAKLDAKASYSVNGGIRLFETFARMYGKSDVKPQTPQEELMQVAVGSLEGYFRSHPLPSERIQMLRNLAASEHWPTTSERDLRVGYIFWADAASRHYKAGKYDQAQHLFQRALDAKPDYRPALQGLGDTQFAQANFSGAAGSYGRLLETCTEKCGDAYHYAEALAAADRASAAGQFERTLRRTKHKEITDEQNANLAGLRLLAGNPKAAKELRARAARTPDKPWVPEVTGLLGWWYYRAGDADTAVTLLDTAVQRRPNNDLLQTRFGWARVDTRLYADAIKSFDHACGCEGHEDVDVSAARMGRAVAKWRTDQKNAAMSDFDSAVKDQPFWLNEAWVQKVYSSAAAQSISEMKLEAERRRKPPAAPRLVPASATQSSPNAEADSAERKLRHIGQNGNLQRPDETPTLLTDSEVNSYFALGRVQLPNGVKQVRFAGEPQILTATARVDFDEITAGKRSSNPLLRIFTGVHDVQAVAQAQGSGGVGELHIQSVSIDDVNVPRMALEFFVDRYVHPKYPNVGLDSRFQMPSRIDTATVGEHKLTVTQK